MKIRTRFATFLAVLALCCTSALVQAQGDPGTDPDLGTEIPLDSGLSLLIAAGVGYAAKKGYDKRKKDKAAQTDGHDA